MQKYLRAYSYKPGNFLMMKQSRNFGVKLIWLYGLIVKYLTRLWYAVHAVFAEKEN